MKKTFVLATALFLAGCTVEIDEIQHTTEEWKTLHQFVYARISEERTKTLIDLEQSPKIRWSEGDEISVFASSVNEQYRFSGEEGDGYGSFNHVSGNTGMQSFLNAYAVYPFQADNLFSDSGIVLRYPAEQVYAQNSFGKGAVPMISVCQAASDLHFDFKPLSGFLRLLFWNAEGKSVRRITLIAPNAKIAGSASVYYTASIDPEVTMSETATNMVSLDCGDGVMLGRTAAEATVFWIAVPPVTMEDGFIIKVEANDGSSFVKSTSISRTVARNVIYTMAPVECEFATLLVLKYETTEPGETVKLFMNESQPGRVAGEDNTLLTLDYGDGTFGTDISHTYAEAGIHRVSMIFEKPVTEIRNSAFVRSTKIDGVEFPNTLLKIGSRAFLATSLKGDLIIPANGVELETGAFSSSGLNYDSIVIPKGTKILSDDNAYRMTFSNIAANTFYLGCDVPDVINYRAPYYEHSFLGGSRLQKLIIGKDVEALGDVLFHGSNIQEIEFEEGSNLKIIGETSITGIDGLKSFTLPSNVTYISEVHQFILCPDLEAFYGNSVNYWTENGVLFTLKNGSRSVFRYPEAKKDSVYVNESVNGLVMHAFRDNNHLKRVRLGLSSGIPDYAFMSCSNLEVVEGCDYPLSEQSYGDPVNIGTSAFRSCTSLREFTIGAAVDTVNTAAFYGCSNLGSVYCKSVIPPVLLDDNSDYPTFGGNAPGRLIYVPAVAVEAYKTAPGWSGYADSIVGQ